MDLPHDVIDLHPAEGACPTEETAVVPIRQQRAKPLMHHLMTIPQRIEHVADDGDIQVVLANEAETIGVGAEHGRARLPDG